MLASRSVALHYVEIEVYDEVVEQRDDIVQYDLTTLNEWFQIFFQGTLS